MTGVAILQKSAELSTHVCGGRFIVGVPASQSNCNFFIELQIS